MNRVNKEERLCKIVWNSEHWEKPIARFWNPKFKTDPNKPYEQKCGFVHEDWLFNTQFLIDGYQYGYIKGFEKLKKSVSVVDLVHLFTINTNTKERFYVGKLLNAERIENGNYSKSVKDVQRRYLSEMKRQLTLVGADVNELDRFPLVFNVRVKKENIHLFQDYLPIISSWFNKQYNRTSPNEITPELKILLTNIESASKFKFIPSSPGGKKTAYTKTSIAGKINISKVHQEIEEHLYAFLKNNGIGVNSIACDTLSFGGKLADVVVQHSKNSYSIYEIKTNIDLRSGLREAVGQLLDYANWEKGITIKELIAVVPDTQAGQQINDYIARIKSSLTYSLKVLLYDNTNHNFKEI